MTTMRFERWNRSPLLTTVKLESCGIEHILSSSQDCPAQIIWPNHYAKVQSVTVDRIVYFSGILV